MLDDHRFWFALVLYFISASLSAFTCKRIKGTKSKLAYIYLIAGLLCSISLWLNMAEWQGTAHLFNITNLIILSAGVLTGFTPLVVPLVFIAPIFFSMIVDVPLNSLKAEQDVRLGELTFFPSEDGHLPLVWNDDKGMDHVFRLEGEKAAIVLLRKTVEDKYFFLKNELIVLGVTSSASLPADLRQSDGYSFYSLREEESVNSDLYMLSYPALKFQKSGFFASYTYLLINEEIVIIRN